MTSQKRMIWLALALIVPLGVTPGVAKAQAPGGETRSLDDELMDSLDSELLEGLETLPVEGAEGSDAAEGESGGVATTDEDEFTRISKRMREIERQMPRVETASSTARAQKQLVSDLEKLIAELEQQCQKCQNASSASSKSSQTAAREQVKQPPSSKPQSGEHDANTPATDSTARLGKENIRKADMQQMRGLLKDLWGQLPEKARDQMLQSSPEQFLPKYELLIEEYYKRLAERP